jgi:hypothetical protein
MKLNVLLFPLLLLLNLISCQLDGLDDDDHMIKKTKVLACIAITKARMAQDVVIILN